VGAELERSRKGINQVIEVCAKGGCPAHNLRFFRSYIPATSSLAADDLSDPSKLPLGRVRSK